MESLPAIFFESNKIGRGEVATKIPTSHGVYPSFEESNLRPGPTSSTPYAGIWDTSQPISACGWRWRCGFPTYHWLISSPETSTETWIDSSTVWQSNCPLVVVKQPDLALMPWSLGCLRLLPHRGLRGTRSCCSSAKGVAGGDFGFEEMHLVTVAVSSSSFGTFGE